MLGAQDSWHIEPVEMGPESGSDDREGMLVITSSSFTFRMMVLLRADDSPATRSYYSASEISGAVGDTLLEATNLFCGAMNRELAHHFPHLGMSTPYALNRGCLSYIEELRPQHVSSYAITINECVRVQATLCLCGYAPIDFSVAKVTLEDTTGALELF